ncbi:RHS repeat domain-containing protein [Moheibacter lacus]|uniref:YD repeat-containing protein n=1 Tax=Moheibacter lacus TaxID=2745851 RepID=A0A838ZTT9_9FLAO|nr:hypothetical protein [Moheibacter lacus]MBA5630382.1 hypothetical protein [Moheibacter lacus]
MKLIKRCIAIILILLSNLNWSQSLPIPQGVQSPTASSLGKFGDLPVSYYTGTAGISIPIHTMTEKNVPLDISLNYDTSGVRLNAIPGWVGENWSLNAGGVITRQEKGLAFDEFHYNTTIGTHQRGYFYSHSLLDVSNWTSSAFLLAINSFWDKDTTPDIFTFNFMGHSGKFFLGQDGSWKVASDSNMKVIINMDDNRYPPQEPNYAYKLIYKITLIDDNGTKYVFGNKQDAIDYSVNFFQQFRGDSNNRVYWRANAWYLTEVRDHLGNLLYDLSYERKEYTVSFNYYHESERWGTTGGDWNANCYSYKGGVYGIAGELMSSVYLKEIKALSGESALFNIVANNNGQGDLGNAYYDRYSGQNNPSGVPSLTGWITQFIENNYPVGSNNLFPYLQEIGGSVNDIYNQFKWYRLNQIEVKLNNSTVRKFILRHNNLPYQSGQPSPRMQLTELERANTIAQPTSSYYFQYNSPLPRDYMTLQTDHWGYYKGSFYSVSGFGSSPASATAMYNSRMPNGTYSLYGLLNTIIYPTGGKTVIEYEPNTYNSYVSDDRSSLISESTTLAGGTRVKRLLDYSEGTTLSKEREFIYQKANGTGSGILEYKPVYFWDWTYPSVTNGAVARQQKYSTNTILPLSNFFGSHIGYSEVKEIVKSNEGNFHTIYKYTSNAESKYRDELGLTNYGASGFSPYSTKNDKSLYRGKLLSTEEYNSSNQPVRKIENTYPALSYLNSHVARGIDVVPVNCPQGLASGFYLKGSAYYLYYLDMAPSTTVVTEYFPNANNIVSTTTFDYKQHPPTNRGNNYLNYQLFESTSLGEKIKENHAYTFDGTFIVDHENSTLLQSILLTANVMKPYKTTNEKLVGSVTEKIAESKTIYGQFTGNGTVFPRFLYKSKANRPLEKELTFDRYDAIGNPEQYTIENQVPVVLVYGYNKKFPIAKIEGKTYGELPQTLIQDIVDASNVPANQNNPATLIAMLQGLREHSSLSNALVTTYTYRPVSGVSSITPPNGITEYYHYDVYGRLQAVKDHNGKIIQEYKYNYKP